jgi:hypothetical protein
LVASTGGIDRAATKAAAERIRGRAEHLSLGRFDWDALKTDGDEGRP